MRNSLKNLIYNAITTDAMFTLAGGPILIAYALLFGAGPIAIGILGSIEFIGNLFYFYSAYLIQRGKKIKRIAIFFSSISRPFYLIMALLAFCPKNDFTLAILIISIFCAYGLSAVNGGAFYPWMKALLPEKIMTSFFAERCRWMMIADIFALGFSAICIFLFKKFFPEQVIYAYAILMIFAFIFGTISVYTLNKVKGVEVKVEATESFSKSLFVVLKNKSFVLFCIFMGFINFSTSFITPFLTVFMLKQNQIEMPFVIILTVISQLTYVYSTQFWKKYAKDKGCLPMLNSGSILYICIILIFSTTMKLSIVPLSIILFLAHILLGYAKFAIKLGTNNLPLFYVPSENSSIYLSLVSVFRACGSLISGVIAGSILLGLQNSIKSDMLAWLMFFVFAISSFLLTIYLSRYIKKKNS